MRTILCLIPKGTSDCLDSGLQELGKVRYLTSKDSDSQGTLAVVSPLISINESFLSRFPAIKMIASIGVGYDKVDLELLKTRGIVMTNAASSTSDDVADLAWALLTSISRNVVHADKVLREKLQVNLNMALGRRISGKRLGIAGLGHIGQEIARRAEGFKMAVGYTNLTDVNVSYQRFDSLKELASWCDYLVIAMPGGKVNRHLVNAEILQALGPEGYLVNIGRGEVVENDALITALENGTIAAAALDVYEGEPAIAPRFARLDNLIMVPHIGSATHEARHDAGLEVLKNLHAYLQTGDAPDRIV